VRGDGPVEALLGEEGGAVGGGEFLRCYGSGGNGWLAGAGSSSSSSSCFGGVLV
jgi:hypothetical protein